jgi:hypothetical protein
MRFFVFNAPCSCSAHRVAERSHRIVLPQYISLSRLEDFLDNVHPLCISSFRPAEFSDGPQPSATRGPLIPSWLADQVACAVYNLWQSHLVELRAYHDEFLTLVIS